MSETTKARSWSGTLEEMPLVYILRQISREQQTGTLSLTNGEETRHFFFEGGQLRTATSDQEHQRIGEFLKRRGVISADALESVLVPQEQIGGRRARLGRLLVEQGFLTPVILDSEMHRLVEEIIFSVFAWDGGKFIFRPSDGRLDSEVALNLSTAAVIIEGSRRLPAERTFLQQLGDLNQVAVVTGDPVSRFQGVRLSPLEAYLLAACDGRMAVGDVLKLGTDKLGAAKALYALSAAGLVEFLPPGTVRRRSTDEVLEAMEAISSTPISPEKDPDDPLARHRELIEKTHARLADSSPYELLGVPDDAGPQAVQEAFARRSRLFDPDLKLRSGLADLAPKINEIHEQLIAAHREISDRRQAGQGEQTDPDPAARLQMARDDYLQARRLLDKNDFYGAIVLLEQAVRFCPENPEYRFLLARALAKNPNWTARAMTQYREAIRLDPYRGELVRDYAEFLCTHGHASDAESLARTLVERAPQDPRNHELLARCRGSHVASMPPPALPDTAPMPRRSRNLLDRLLRRA